MDPWFITFIVFGAILVVVGGFTLFLQGDERRGGAMTTGVVFFLALCALFLSSFKVVGAKDIGVPVLFGKPKGEVYHNGWNWKNPAEKVHIFDGALQTEHFSTDKNDDGDPVNVRLFTGSVAGVNVTFQWKLEDDDSVKQVYLNYREPNKINQNLVKRALQQSLNDVFSKYNPYTALIVAQAKANGDNSPGTQQVATTYEDLQTQALDKLKSEMAPQGVSAVSLTIASINFDQKTQDNLNNLGTAITQTQIALQNEKTAAAQAESNRLLNSTPATNTTLQQLCIQASEKVLEGGHNLPAGWNCFGPSNVAITNSGK
jgi:regulator of protease activity HflC (stomatin/prohibitin superfamily)